MLSQGLHPNHLKDTNPSHVNKGIEVEHRGHHLITSQCGRPLTNAREPTNNQNGTQGT